MYRKHPNHTYGRNRNKSANNWAIARYHHGQTIHSIEKFISINLFKTFCVVTWAQLFLTSMVMEVVRGQKLYCECTLWHSKTIFGSSHSATSGILE